MNTSVVVIAGSAASAMSFAKRIDTPVDLGPPKDPTRYPPGHRRWGFGVTPAPTATPAIMERIRKLLVLAERGSEHEATAAAAAAQKLMAAHSLTEALLAVDTDSKDEEIADSVMEGFQKRVVHWKGILANMLSRANGCEAYWHRSARGLELRILGTKSVSDTVCQLYCWLVVEIDRLAARETVGMGKAYAHAWRLGCATRIGDRVLEAAEQAREAAETEAKAIAALEAGKPGTGLARVDAALARLKSDMTRVQEVMKQFKFRKGAPSKTSNLYGYVDGFIAGNRVNLSGSTSLGAG